MMDRRELIANLDNTIGFQALITELERPLDERLKKLIRMAMDDNGKYTDSQLAASFRSWASQYNMVQLIKRLPSQVEGKE